MITVATAYLNYADTPVDDSSYVEMTLLDDLGNPLSPNVLPAEVTQVEIQDSGGGMMALGVSDENLQVGPVQQVVYGPNESSSKIPVMLGKGASIGIIALESSAVVDMGAVSIRFMHGRK